MSAQPITPPQQKGTPTMKITKKDIDQQDHDTWEKVARDTLKAFDTTTQMLLERGDTLRAEYDRLTASRAQDIAEAKRDALHQAAKQIEHAAYFDASHDNTDVNQSWLDAAKVIRQLAEPQK